MKKIIYILMCVTSVVACKKNDSSIGTTPTTSGNLIFYIDSAKIYSTDLSGNNRKLVVGLDTTNPNSYISNWVTTTADAGKIYFRHHISGTSPSIKQYVVNSDGTGLVLIKNMATPNYEYGVTKLTTDGKLTFYQNQWSSPGAYTNTLQSLSLDGSTQTTLGTIPGTFTHLIWGINRAGDRFLSTQYSGSANTVYAGTLISGVPSSPRSLPAGINKFSYNDDGKKVAYLKSVSASSLEIYVYDVVAETSSLVATYTIPTGATDDTQICWADGTNKILVSTGFYTFPRGASTDYTSCSVYTVGSSATPVTFKFSGDGSLGKIFTSN